MEPITNFDQFPDREPQFNSLLQNLESESKNTTIDKLMGIISLIYIEHESSYMYNITFIPNPDLEISNKLGGGLREEFKKFAKKLIKANNVVSEEEHDFYSMMKSIWKM